MEIAPCKDCEDRHLGCHSDCKKYAEFKAEIERMKANKDRDLKGFYDSIQFYKDTRKKFRIYRGWRND